jgi:hypothetical protein
MLKASADQICKTFYLKNILDGLCPTDVHKERIASTGNFKTAPSKWNF